MTVPANTNALLLNSAAPAAYQISRSLRFNSADSAYLSRTPGSAGNRKTFTLSLWIKRTKFADNQAVFAAGDLNGVGASLRFNTSDQLAFAMAGATIMIQTTRVFRDPSAWYHIVLLFDTTQATAANRMRLFVNGTEETAFASATYPTQNTDHSVNSTSAHQIGREDQAGTFGQYFNGYIADVYLLDGTATTPSTFAETDAITGQWVPKTPTGISYGTNGFRLTFSDNSGTTSTTLGKDSAGSNNWTPNNFSVASGSGNDSLVDSPTSYGTDARNGGEVRGNYCTWNPLDQSGITFSNGNLDTTGGGICRATFGLASGKWYWEQTVITKSDGANNPRGGVATASASLTNDLGAAATQWVMFMAGGSNGGKGYNAGTITGSGSAFAVNDVAMFAYDADAGKLWFGRNGTWITGDPAAGTSPFYSSVTAPVFPVAQEGSSSSVVNYGQRAFSYQAPSGYKALCDTNLTAPTIAKPANYFDVKLYTGNGSGQTLSGLAFGPDLVWIKNRVDAEVHGLFDQVRGADLWLSSNLTDAETNYGGGFGVTAFTSSGFTVGTGTAVNGNNEAHVAWAWDAASSNSTNTSGTITSTVRASATSGFSVVTWSGTNSDGTIGHGLGAQPALIIAKNRTSANEWCVLHSKGYSGSWGVGYLRQTAAFVDITGNFTGSNFYDRTAPTSTVFSVSGNKYASSDSGSISGQNYVAYCFTPVANFSAMGVYTGNGSSDGPFVFTGFRPRWILIKVSAGDTGNWWMYDSARSSYNLSDSILHANLSLAEFTSNGIDILSNGFKIRTSNGNTNGSGFTFVWAAFAENPFQYARAR